MKSRLWKLAVLFFVLFAAPYFFLVAATSSAEFKSFAEERVSEYLNADVAIGKIRIGFLNRIVLSQFQIRTDASTSSPYRIEVERVVFRYSLFQLLQRNFKTPSAILLKSPRIVLTQKGSPEAFFNGVHVQPSAASGMSMLELSGGEVRYELPALDSEILLKDITASFKPALNGTIKAGFKARLEGAMTGHFEAEGRINPITQERDWVVKLRSFSLMSGLLPEGNEGSARFHLQNDTLSLESFRLKASGTEFQASGRVDDLGPGARIQLNAEGRRKLQNFSMQAAADLKTRQLRGNLETPLTKTQFQGKIKWQNGRLLLSDLESANGHHIEASLDWNERHAQVQIENEKQQMEWQAKWGGKQTDLAYHVNHLDWMGMDLVSAGTLLLQPVRAQGSEGFHFQTYFQTDYFILEYMPFENLKGSFDASAAGIQNIAASWGKIFKASGEITRSEAGMETDLMVRVNGFDLAQVRHFASRPLPRELGGILKGQVKIRGTLSKPFASGKFTVRHGRVGPVEYDSGILQFDGLMPYLKLKDSRILKGRTSLTMTGALDLSLKNMFYGVQIRKFDQGILWNGMDMSVESLKEGLDLELDGVLNLPALSMKAGKETAPEQDAGNENYLEMGPRFRF